MPGACFDGGQEVVLLGIREVLGGERIVPAKDDQVIPAQVPIEGEDVLGFFEVESEFTNQIAGPLGDVVRTVARPTSIEIQGVGHASGPFLATFAMKYSTTTFLVD